MDDTSDDSSTTEEEVIVATAATLLLLYVHHTQVLQQQHHQEQQLQEQPQLLPIIQEPQQQQQGRKKRKKRRNKVRSWLQRRRTLGHNDSLLIELENEDISSFINYLRMKPETFYEILERITPLIEKENTTFGNTISPRLRLAATLRFLATGASSKTIGYAFRVSYQVVCTFIIEVCQAIIYVYGKEVIITPSTPEEWKEVAKGYWQRWNFPHCIGAIDGKHVALRKPRKSGSEFHNYKGFFSIVLLAVVDSDYKFLYIDVGQPGSGSDAGVFNVTDFKEQLENGEAGLPEPEPLPGEENLEGHRDIGYFIVGDDAFALKTWMMKPLPLRYMSRQQRIFNYRLSRARRVVENVFGILANRFRCLLTTLQQEPEKVSTITVACCVLHNLLRIRNPTAQDVAAPDAGDNDDRSVQAGEMHDLGRPYQGHNVSRIAKEQRDYLVHFVNSPHGSVPWQDNSI